MPNKLPSPIDRPLRDPVWEKQPGETPLAYSYFRAFRDSPRRSVERTAEMHGVSRSNLANVARAKAWAERAEAYDAWLDTRNLAVTEAAVRHAAAETSRRILEMEEQEWLVAEASMARITEMLAIPANPLTAHRDAAGLLRETLKLWRLRAGLPTEGPKAAAPDPTADRLSDVDAFMRSLGAEDEGESEESPAPDPAAPAVESPGEG